MNDRPVKIGKTGMKIRAVSDGAKPPKKQPLPWDMGFTEKTWAEKLDEMLFKYSSRGQMAKEFMLERFQEMARRADLYDAEHGSDGDAVNRGSNDR